VLTTGKMLHDLRSLT